MHPALNVLVASAAIAVAVVVVRSQSARSEQLAWGQLATAEAQGASVEALEVLREQAKGTSAEPWLDYQLAFQLYEKGGVESLERATQVASDAVSRFPRHAVAPWLKKLVAAANSLANATGHS